MAGQPDRLSAAARELLTKVKEEGSAHILLNELMDHESSEFEVVSSGGYQLAGGSMNDSVKRRSQRPILKVGTKVLSKIELPKGITSMEHWGKTLITAGKLSKRE